VPYLREDIARKICVIVPRWQIFVSCILASRVQHVSRFQTYKFALKPHRMCKYGRHPICDGWY